MSFLEEVTELSPSKPNHVCKVKLFIDGQDTAALAKAKKDPVTDADLFEAKEVSTLKAIHRALVNRGFEFSDNVLANHLKRDCQCARAKAAQ